MRALVGLTGRKRSGKDTAAAVFQASGYQSLSFATMLKQMLALMLQMQGLDDETIHRMLHDDLKEVPTPFLNSQTPRYAMQSLGTEWGRNLIHPNLWVDATMRAAENFDLVIIPDVRFPNEVKAILDRGGSVYRINREGVERDDHESEALVDTLQVTGDIYNTAGSAEDFQREISLFLSHSRGILQ
ncbi:MAG: hypothetical protein ACK4FG_01995 [Brevundimonas sp.]